ncbi:MAG: DUF1570 domain-containing protein [Phycisphaerae bacterium]
MSRFRSTVIIVLFLGVLTAPHPSAAQPEVRARIREAELILKDMGLEYDTLESKFFHILFVGAREFALERQRILVKTRNNLIGLTRRMKLKVNQQHEKLLVILLDSQEQMKQFAAHANGGNNLADWVAGYYQPLQNWAVFYNQRKGSNLAQAERELNRMAQRLLQMEGGPDVIVRINTPNGVVSKSKRQVAREMEAEWARIVAETMEFNTVVTQHEGTHQLAYNMGLQRRDARYPFWVSEGLACVFESPPDRRQVQGAARLNEDRLIAYRRAVRQNKNLGMQKLASLHHPDAHHDIHGLYAESWAMFAFFFKRYPVQLAAYMQHLADRPAKSTESEIEAIERFMKKPITILEKEFERYIKRLKA